MAEHRASSQLSPTTTVSASTPPPALWGSLSPEFLQAVPSPQRPLSVIFLELSLPSGHSTVWLSLKVLQPDHFSSCPLLLEQMEKPQSAPHEPFLVKWQQSISHAFIHLFSLCVLRSSHEQKAPSMHACPCPLTSCGHGSP